jgi:hypothetical protein
MKATTLAALIGAAEFAIGGVPIAQTTGPPASSASTSGSGYNTPSAPSGRTSGVAEAGKRGANTSGASSTSTHRPDTHRPEPRDRRVKALQGADSASLPNVDPAAAANQIQIPDYPPLDSDQASARSGHPPPPR